MSVRKNDKDEDGEKKEKKIYLKQWDNLRHAPVLKQYCGNSSRITWRAASSLAHVSRLSATLFAQMTLSTVVVLKDNKSRAHWCRKWAEMKDLMLFLTSNSSDLCAHESERCLEEKTWKQLSWWADEANEKQRHNAKMTQQRTESEYCALCVHCSAVSSGSAWLAVVIGWLTPYRWRPKEEEKSIVLLVSDRQSIRQ